MISILFPNKPIKYAKREPREHNGKMKFSYQIYVLNVRITSKNLKQLIFDNKLEKNFDTSIYSSNRIIFLPLTTEKKDHQKVPVLEIIDGDFFDCCASYIEEDYEDYDKVMNSLQSNKIEQKIQYERIEVEEEYDENDKSVEFIKDIISRFSNERAKNYTDWSSVCFAIIGACKKSKIGKTACSNLIHQFSKLALNSYEEDNVDKWIDENYKRQMERTDKQFSYNYLIHSCLKEDDFEYYDEKFNRSYKEIKKKFEKCILKIDNEIRYVEIFHERDEFIPEAFRSLTKEELIHKFSDMKGFKYVEIETDKKGNKIKNEVNIVSKNSKWWADENKRRCLKLIFKPCKLSDELSKRYFNMFQGFRAEHLPVHKNYQSIERILFHLKNVICNKDENTFNWFLKYLRAILKGEHTKVMIMIKGLEGCGKNIFLNMFAYGIIGSDYSVATSSPERHFFGNFNSLLINRVFGVINEGKHGMRDCIDLIKDYIT